MSGVVFAQKKEVDVSVFYNSTVLYGKYHMFHVQNSTVHKVQPVAQLNPSSCQLGHILPCVCDWLYGLLSLMELLLLHAIFSWSCTHPLEIEQPTLRRWKEAYETHSADHQDVSLAFPAREVLTEGYWWQSQGAHL